MARIRTIKPEPELWTVDDIDATADGFWLYCITEAGSEDAGPCKVGVATDFNKRLSSLQGGNWRRLTPVWLIKTTDRLRALDGERYCLEMLRPSAYGTTTKKQLASEWVEATPLKALQIVLMLMNAESECVRRAA